jgi:opacity protein-like surface antigen
MKRFLTNILFALFAFLAVSVPAFGQKTYALGVGGGASIPVAKLSDSQRTGYNGIIVLAVGVAELPIGIRLDGIYNSFVFRTAPVGSPSGSDLRVLGALGNLIYAFSGTSAKPYLIVGGGVYNTKRDIPGEKSDNNFGFNAGLGATFAVGPFATFLESRYHSISRNADKGGVIQFVPITFGLLF